MSDVAAKLSHIGEDFAGRRRDYKPERIQAVSDEEICACSDVNMLRRWSNLYGDVAIELETKLQFWGPYTPDRMDAFYGTRSSLALFKVAIGRIHRRLKHIQNEAERMRRAAASGKE